MKLILEKWVKKAQGNSNLSPAAGAMWRVLSTENWFKNLTLSARFG
ncbi:MAG: hypothetical protein WCF74_15530 [Candidatus Sulfotelmatobacter sp.]